MNGLSRKVRLGRMGLGIRISWEQYGPVRWLFAGIVEQISKPVFDITERDWS